jgi:hypothetical protein
LIKEIIADKLLRRLQVGYGVYRLLLTGEGFFEFWQGHWEKGQSCR